MTYLVTGGTGALGRPVVAALRAAGHDVRVLSRHPGAGHVVGDLTTGELPADALSRVDTVVHLINGFTKELRATETLLAAAKAAGVGHVVYISIVGVDRIPFGYYTQKLASERAIEASGIPFTIQRATQFHGFIAGLFRAQRRLPVLFAPTFRAQPIDVTEVAERITQLALSGPAGHVADIGGPEQRQLIDLARVWLGTQSRSKPVWKLRVPGATMRAFRSGYGMTPLPGYGTRTFEQYLAAESQVAR